MALDILNDAALGSLIFGVYFYLDKKKMGRSECNTIHTDIKDYHSENRVEHKDIKDALTKVHDRIDGLYELINKGH